MISSALNFRPPVAADHGICILLEHSARSMTPQIMLFQARNFIISLIKLLLGGGEEFQRQARRATNYYTTVVCLDIPLASCEKID